MGKSRMRAYHYWAVALAVAAGLALGLGTYTFIYAKGYSYLTNDPAACANCHVMNDYYAGWMKSAHHTVATCNDCHTPEGFFAKYAVKALNGWNHSLAFTSGNYIEPLRVTELNRKVAHGACQKCHATLVHPLAMGGARHESESAWPTCTHCHGAVGHPM